MQQHLVISAIGSDRPGIVNELSRIIVDNQCNIDDSRMSVLGGEFAIILKVSGAVDAVNQLENSLSTCDIGLTILTRRTQEGVQTGESRPYHVEVTSIDHPGIVAKVADFFSRQQINIQNLETEKYPAPHTGTDMFAMEMELNVPGDISISQLKGQFLDLCDEMNLDGQISAL